MKRTISKKGAALLMLACVALVFASSRKDQNMSTANGTYDKVDAGLNGEGLIPAFPVCGPIPSILNVEQGNKLVLTTFARGVQIYEVKRSTTDPDVFTWVNIAPKATLYLTPNFKNEIIDHFAGPSWEFTKGPEKGEKVVAARQQGITQDQTAIQWLLLKAVPSLSTPNNKITFIQRICTVGGLAPTTVPTESMLGQKDSIPYTASYLFYVKS